MGLVLAMMYTKSLSTAKMTFPCLDVGMTFILKVWWTVQNFFCTPLYLKKWLKSTRWSLCTTRHSMSSSQRRWKTQKTSNFCLKWNPWSHFLQVEILLWAVLPREIMTMFRSFTNRTDILNWVHYPSLSGRQQVCIQYLPLLDRVQVNPSLPLTHQDNNTVNHFFVYFYEYGFIIPENHQRIFSFFQPDVKSGLLWVCFQCFDGTCACMCNLLATYSWLQDESICQTSIFFFFFLIRCTKIWVL